MYPSHEKKGRSTRYLMRVMRIFAGDHDQINNHGNHNQTNPVHQGVQPISRSIGYCNEAELLVRRKVGQRTVNTNQSKEVYNSIAFHWDQGNATDRSRENTLHQKKNETKRTCHTSKGLQITELTSHHTRRKEKSPSERKWETMTTTMNRAIHRSIFALLAFRYFLKSLQFTLPPNTYNRLILRFTCCNMFTKLMCYKKKIIVLLNNGSLADMKVRSQNPPDFFSTCEKSIFVIIIPFETGWSTTSFQQTTGQIT